MPTNAMNLCVRDAFGCTRNSTGNKCIRKMRNKKKAETKNVVSNKRRDESLTE